MRHHLFISILAVLILLALSCTKQPTGNGIDDNEITYRTYSVVQSFPHDINAFTQGFVYKDSLFFEGTGLYGKSSLRKVDPETGNVLQLFALENAYFGEGITIFQGKIYQLTWKSNIGFIYDYSSFDTIGQFTYDTEGWGLTHNGSSLIMSDGTNILYFINPDNMQIASQIEVSDDQGPVSNINELEFISGYIYANIWLTDYIVIIDPNTGRVTDKIDMTGLLDPSDIAPTTDVLNGIAYDNENDRLFVTGKYWPKVFEIKIIEVTESQ